MSHTINFSECYGCGLCVQVCKVHAIQMVEDYEGFLHPVVDKEKCIGCGKCSKICIANQIVVDSTPNKGYYAVSLTNQRELEKSTSGGMFYALAKYFVENDGYVCGSIWSIDFKAIHIVTNKLEDVEKMRGSKYTQSDCNACFEKIKKLVSLNKVLFAGTPCQVEAIRRYIGDSRNLYCCALVCEGTASPKVWRMYKEYLERKYGSKLSYVNMREKNMYGWKEPVAVYKFENGKEERNLAYALDYYVKAFIEGVFFRNSCYQCQYRADKVKSDFIIGDWWGIDKKSLKRCGNKGMSLVWVKTDKGKQLFSELKNLIVNEISYKQMINKNKSIFYCIQKPEERASFFSNLERVDIISNIKENTNLNSISTKAIRFMVNVHCYGFYRKIRRLIGE